MSPFAETKARVKYHFKNSKFAEAKEVMDTYINEHPVDQMTLDERSKVILRLVLSLNKGFYYKQLGKALVTLVRPALEVSKESMSAHARLIYAYQRITTALALKEQNTQLKEVAQLLKDNQESFAVAKYFVKTHLNVPKDGFLMDAKEAFVYVKEAERVNEEFLVKKHGYNKLSIKIHLIKIKNFDMFFTQTKFQ